MLTLNVQSCLQLGGCDGRQRFQALDCQSQIDGGTPAGKEESRWDKH